MEEYNENTSDKKTLLLNLTKTIFKWISLSTIMGIAVGIVIGYFNILLKYANSFRKENKYIIYFLPAAGVFIAYIYVKTKRNAYSGENLLKSEVQKAAKNIPLYMIAVVFTGSFLTTLFGGSAGKEGSGVAMGGTFGDYLARKLKLNDNDQRALVMSGVGSAFGVIYNVPYAGALLGMELVIKGSFNYEALIPALLSSVIASEVSLRVGNKPIKYKMLNLQQLNFILALKLIIIGILFGLVGMLFNYALDNSSKIYSFFIKSPLIKGFTGGLITIILYLIAGNDYNGLGQDFISSCFETPARSAAFLWKIIFTAVALGSVFQGGRGNPVFFTGAAFGSSIAGLFNIPLESGAALGMIGVFCAAQSLPITSIAMAIEYFGSEEILAIMIIMLISYAVSAFYDILTKEKLPDEKSKMLSANNKK